MSSQPLSQYQMLSTSRKYSYSKVYLPLNMPSVFSPAWCLSVCVQVHISLVNRKVRIFFLLEYGGLGLDYSFSIAAGEALGTVNCGSIPMAVAVQTDMSTPALAR